MMIKIVFQGRIFVSEVYQIKPGTDLIVQDFASWSSSGAGLIHVSDVRNHLERRKDLRGIHLLLSIEEYAPMAIRGGRYIDQGNL